MSLRTPLGIVKGLGSARSGTHHWWAQRLSAVALVPLTIWFVVELLRLCDAPHSAVVAWLQSPLQATLMLALIIAVFYHAQLGMQVVFEDYVHTPWLKVPVLVASRLVLTLLGLAAVIAVLQITLSAPSPS
jgi:succinate dehydrogenase / fumarate reductase membrane anchor subunit